LWRSLRIRGATSVPPRQRLTVAGEGLATLVLYGFERSQRLYATMLLRGHTGRICGCRHYAELGRADLVVLGVAVLFVAAVLGLWGAP
jgi:energy-coupling factor transporter transmembrane protein EcfT